MDNRPIGVFDSGLGGLTVVKSITENLPYEDIVYLGDTARVPYGNRSKETLLSYVKSDFEFLLSKDVKAVVIACNTADSRTRPEMEEMFHIPIIGVVAPAGKEAAITTKNNKIGVIGTEATVESGAYPNIIKKTNPDATVIQTAAPLLVPLVEAGRTAPGDIVTENVLRGYLEPMAEHGIDTLILGCTHYPLLKDIIASILPGVNLICSGFASTNSLIDTLGALRLSNKSDHVAKVEYFVSDAPESFAKHAGVFLQKEISGLVKKVKL